MTAKQSRLWKLSISSCIPFIQRGYDVLLAVVTMHISFENLEIPTERVILPSGSETGSA